MLAPTLHGSSRSAILPALRTLAWTGIGAVAACTSSPTSDTALVRPWDDAFAPRSTGPYRKEATCALFAPWEQEGVWALRAPETIGSNRGLLFVDHTKEFPKPVARVRRAAAVGAGRRWEPVLYLRTRCRDSIRRPPSCPRGARCRCMRLWSMTLRMTSIDSRVSSVSFRMVVRGFEDPRAERTFILLDGAFVPLAATGPGDRSGGNARLHHHTGTWRRAPSTEDRAEAGSRARRTSLSSPRSPRTESASSPSASTRRSS